MSLELFTNSSGSYGSVNKKENLSETIIQYTDLHSRLQTYFNKICKDEREGRNPQTYNV